MPSRRRGASNDQSFESAIVPEFREKRSHLYRHRPHPFSGLRPNLRRDARQRLSARGLAVPRTPQPSHTASASISGRSSPPMITVTLDLSVIRTSPSRAEPARVQRQDHIHYSTVMSESASCSRLGKNLQRCRCIKDPASSSVAVRGFTSIPVFPQ
jgi:hypothetical protein